MKLEVCLFDENGSLLVSFSNFDSAAAAKEPTPGAMLHNLLAAMILKGEADLASFKHMEISDAVRISFSSFQENTSFHVFLVSTKDRREISNGTGFLPTSIATLTLDNVRDAVLLIAGRETLKNVKKGGVHLDSARKLLFGFSNALKAIAFNSAHSLIGSLYDVVPVMVQPSKNYGNFHKLTGSLRQFSKHIAFMSAGSLMLFGTPEMLALPPVDLRTLCMFLAKIKGATYGEFALYLPVTSPNSVLKILMVALSADISVIIICKSDTDTMDILEELFTDQTKRLLLDMGNMDYHIPKLRIPGAIFSYVIDFTTKTSHFYKYGATLTRIDDMILDGLPLALDLLNASGDAERKGLIGFVAGPLSVYVSHTKENDVLIVFHGNDVPEVDIIHSYATTLIQHTANSSKQRYYRAVT